MARTSSESSSDRAEGSASSSRRATGSNRGSSKAGSAETSDAETTSAEKNDAETNDAETNSAETNSAAKSSSSRAKARGGASKSLPTEGAASKRSATGTSSAARREAAKRASSDVPTKSAAEKREAEQTAKSTAALSKTPTKRDDAEKGRGFVGTIALFLRQVMAELRKVVTPTRAELFRFTGVVLVFVIIMMIFVSGLDLLFGWGASWVFGTGTEVQWPDFSGLFGGTPDQTVPAP